jgi:hypothetical protein
LKICKVKTHEDPDEGTDKREQIAENVGVILAEAACPFEEKDQG